MIQKYRLMELCITTIDEIYTIHCNNNLFYILYKRGILLEIPFERVMMILLSSFIDSIEIYGSIGTRYINKTIYNYKNNFAQTIQVAWRKNRLRTARIRNDLILHGLAEWWYHPSRITFDY